MTEFEKMKIELTRLRIPYEAIDNARRFIFPWCDIAIMEYVGGVTWHVSTRKWEDNSTLMCEDFYGGAEEVLKELAKLFLEQDNLYYRLSEIAKSAEKKRNIEHENIMFLHEELYKHNVPHTVAFDRSGMGEIRLYWLGEHGRCAVVRTSPCSDIYFIDDKPPMSLREIVWHICEKWER